MNALANFFHKYLLKEPKYLLYYFFYYVFDWRNSCMFYNGKELVGMLSAGRSIIRMGDGELALMRGLSIGYQKYNKSLKDDLYRIVINYNSNSPYILSIPIFVNYSNNELKNFRDSAGILHNRRMVWTPLRSLYGMIFNKKVKYGDAHFFYRDGNFQKYILPYLRKKKIVVIAKESIKEKVMRSDIGGNVVSYISCPDVDAYYEKDNLIEALRFGLGQTREDIGNIVIVLSAGLAKVIAFYLSNAGYQVIDIGMGLEGYLDNGNIECRI